MSGEKGNFVCICSRSLAMTQDIMSKYTLRSLVQAILY